MKRIVRTVAIAALLIAGTISAAGAKTFRWASDGDVATLDPYARQETFLLSFLGNIYEPLVRRGRDLRIEPALATHWKQIGPEVWRFTLRRGATFQDGTPFTADDVVFSHLRATGPGSNLGTSLLNIKEVLRVDAGTVDIVTKGPDPLLPDEIVQWNMMSRAWCEGHDADHPAELGKGEQNYATDHANGTGPFAVANREPDVRTTLVRNPAWWDKPEHNLDAVIFSRIADGKSRIDALTSGDVDMIFAVPSQEMDRVAATPHLRLIHGPELRTIFLGFDLARTELLESNVKGRNPFRDIRVRKAFYQAIDENAIKDQVMRGFAAPTGLMVGPGAEGFDPALNRRRLPFDPVAAKKLMAAAGYGDGFELGMDCPSDRYINDAAICEAVAGMLSRIDIRVTPRIQTRSEFFRKILGPNYKTSFYLLGWTPTTYDALNMLVNLVETRIGKGHGDFNVGGYSNLKLDALIAHIQTEPENEKRASWLREALLIVKDDIPTIPLHQQEIVWAARDDIDLVQPADGTFPLRYVRMK